MRSTPSRGYQASLPYGHGFLVNYMKIFGESEKPKPRLLAKIQKKIKR